MQHINGLKENGIFNIENENDFSYFIDDLKSNGELVLTVKNDTVGRLSVLNSKQLVNSKITINIETNGEFEAFFADFSTGKGKIDVEINLLNEGAKASWHLASLSSNDDSKEFNVCINHLCKNTYAKSENYGVCKDEAKLVFSGISKINNGSINSKTYQNAKIMVFDSKSIAIAKPILKIDENDVEASHSAIVGKINDEHLFYLTSRGLTESMAKELITFGYLKPILNGFDDNLIKDEINTLIERKM